MRGYVKKKTIERTKSYRFTEPADSLIIRDEVGVKGFVTLHVARYGESKGGKVIQIRGRTNLRKTT